MKRREVMILLGGAAVAWPLPTRAQPKEGSRRVGVLIGISANDPTARAREETLLAALQALGWKQGQNVAVTFRFAGGQAHLFDSYAEELVNLKPDVILAVTSPAVEAILKFNKTVPIVFVSVVAPERRGLIENLEHPGGNLTGFTNFESSMGGKWLEALKQMAPRVARVGLMFNPETSSSYADLFLTSVQAAAPAYEVKDVLAIPVRNASDIEAQVAGIARTPDSALIVLPDNLAVRYRKLIIEQVAQQRLPAVYPFRSFAVDGGLMVYGIDQNDVFKQAAAYIHRILKGEKPGDLPVQAPNTFELVINLKTAKALGLTVSPWLLAAANETIE
jgi:putative ABC transport system substrate-binding protein